MVNSGGSRQSNRAAGDAERREGKTMTYDEFIAQLRKSRRKWVLVEVDSKDGWILSAAKRERDRHSPLTAVAVVLTRKDYRRKSPRGRSPFYNSDYAGVDLGFPEETICEIENASLGIRPYRKKVRADLLAATRLTKTRSISRHKYGI